MYLFNFAHTCLRADVGKAGAEREFKDPVDCLARIHKSDEIKVCSKALMCPCGELSSSKLPTLVSMTLQRECFQIPVFTSRVAAVCHPYGCLDFLSLWQSSWSHDMHAGTFDCWRKMARGRFLSRVDSPVFSLVWVELHACLLWRNQEVRGLLSTCFRTPWTGMLFYTPYFEHSEEILWACLSYRWQLLSIWKWKIIIVFWAVFY